MRSSGIHHVLRIAMLGAVVLGVITSSGVAQTQRSQQQKVPPTAQVGADGMPLDQPSVVPDPMRARLEQERLKSVNDDRHKRLAADVDRLVALTNELKTDVDKTTKDELSVDVIKKAQEIEKLAHDVQSRMKN